MFLKEEKICYKKKGMLHFAFGISQLSEIEVNEKPTFLKRVKFVESVMLVII